MQLITILFFLLFMVQAILFLYLEFYMLSALFSFMGIVFTIIVSFHKEL